MNRPYKRRKTIRNTAYLTQGRGEFKAFQKKVKPEEMEPCSGGSTLEPRKKNGFLLT
jgi:hypothetical protein